MWVKWLLTKWFSESLPLSLSLSRTHNISASKMNGRETNMGHDTQHTPFKIAKRWRENNKKREKHQESQHWNTYCLKRRNEKTHLFASSSRLKFWYEVNETFSLGLLLLYLLLLLLWWWKGFCNGHFSEYNNDTNKFFFFSLLLRLVLLFSGCICSPIVLLLYQLKLSRTVHNEKKNTLTCTHSSQDRKLSYARHMYCFLYIFSTIVASFFFHPCNRYI